MLLLLLCLHPVLLVLRCSVKDIPLPLSVRADFEHAGLVAATIAVVRCAPYCRQPVVEHDHVALVTKLMCPQYVVHRVDLEKLFDHLCPKRIACTSWTQRELVSISIWITPDQICHWPFVRYLSKPVDDLYLVYAVYAWAESSVNAKDLVIDDAGQRKVVEHVREIVPDCCVAIFATAFGVEAIRLRNASRFVIASNEMYSKRVSELETDQQRDCFDAEQTAIHIITCTSLLALLHTIELVACSWNLPRKR